MSSTTNTSSRKRLRVREIVLVVVEDVLIRMVIADYLRQCGYKVIEAANANEAVTILENPESRVDVIFRSVEAHGARDGFTLSHWVREHRPDLNVILAGSLARAASSAGDLCEQGPHGKKPYETTSIIAQVSQLLAAAKRNKGRPPAS